MNTCWVCEFPADAETCGDRCAEVVKRFIAYKVRQQQIRTFLEGFRLR